MTTPLNIQTLRKLLATAPTNVDEAIERLSAYELAMPALLDAAEKSEQLAVENDKLKELADWSVIRILEAAGVKHENFGFLRGGKDRTPEEAVQELVVQRDAALARCRELEKERDRLRVIVTEIKKLNTDIRNGDALLREQLEAARRERDEEKSENESTLTGRMEYLAEMGFPYGCTWDEAIHACKTLRAEIAALKANKQ